MHGHECGESGRSNAHECCDKGHSCDERITVPVNGSPIEVGLEERTIVPTEQVLAEMQTTEEGYEGQAIS